MMNQMQESQQQTLLYLLNYLQQHDYQFTAITPLSHQRILDRKQQQPDTNLSLEDIFGWNIKFKPADLDPSLFSRLKDHQLLQEQHGYYSSQIRVASLEQQLFIHSAFPTLAHDAVFFGPDTYRFSYHLKQHLTQQPRPFKRAVELCCGSSAAAVSMAQHFPDYDELFVADLNPTALLYSQINISFAGLAHLYPVQSNLFSNLVGAFDLIFANPPYLIDPQQRQYRHGGHELNGNALSFRIIQEGIQRLLPGGQLFLYTGVTITQYGNPFLDCLQKLLASYPHMVWSYEEIDPDIFGEELEQPAYQHIDRIALALVKIEIKNKIFL